MNNPVQSQTISNANEQAISDNLKSAIFLLLMGCGLLYFTGFSHLDTVHNAAHDSRHSAAFPCH